MKLLLLVAILVALFVIWRLRTARGAGAAALPPAEIALDATPDTPVSFGYKSIWLAIRSGEPEAVIEALGRGPGERANWRTGLFAAYADGTFISPPVEGWVLVVDPGMPNLGHPPHDERWRSLLVPLAKRFPEVQYFATHRVVEYHAWARFENGELVRAYAWAGESGETLTDFGEPTETEVDLGHAFFDGRAPERAEESDPEGDEPDAPSETDVMNVAGGWSLDPTQLDERGGKPGLGWLLRHPGR